MTYDQWVTSEPPDNGYTDFCEKLWADISEEAVPQEICEEFEDVFDAITDAIFAFVDDTKVYPIAKRTLEYVGKAFKERQQQ